MQWGMQWGMHDTVLFSQNPNYYPNYSLGNKYACFDLDGTIICPKSGLKYVKNKEDWEFKFQTIKDILHKYQKNYHIVIFTNQAGIKLIGIDNWKEMICDITNKIGIQMDIFAATEYDLYRKPYPTMWTKFINGKNVNEKSFYCGDACGREKDFSDSDYKFALNCELKFYTPEELFLKTKYVERPRISYKIDFKKYLTKDYSVLEIRNEDIIVMVGNYASGKTHLVNTYLIPNGYISVKTIEDVKYYMDKKKLIVIDDINLKKTDRSVYIEIAKQYNYSCRCINIICPIMLSIHNSRYRHFVTNGKCKIISDDIIGQYKDRFEYPTIDEGFNGIIKYNFKIDMSSNISKYFLFLF